jgi:signal transduction histidine kinase
MKAANPLLEAVHAATAKLASVGDVNAVLRDVLSICIEAVGAGGGTIYLHEVASHRLRFLHVLPDEVANRLERLDIPDDFGIAGMVFQTGEVSFNEFPHGGDPNSTSIKEKSGVVVKTMITVPLQVRGLKPIGIIQLVNKDGGFTETDESVLETVCSVCTLAVINSRLLAQSNRAASLEGMGRAAHDLANKAGVLMTFLPDFERNLEALRGTLRLQGVKGDACFYLDMLEGTFRDVFSPYSERVYRYARLINDLAAGKPLKPKLRRQSFAHVVNEAVEYMQPQAKRNWIQLTCEPDFSAPEFQFDDLFVIRITENLVGNAIKATRDQIPQTWIDENAGDPDAIFGQIVVRTEYVDGKHILRVVDEGPGISPGAIREILSGQAKTSWSQSSGTGLGTKVVLELTEALGGKISIKSKLGEGATFTIEFPERVPATLPPL